MIIDIKDIRIEKKDSDTKRARKMLGDVSGLAASIKAHGLLHPVVVETCSSTDPKLWKLVAGERRLRACILNEQTTIEAKLLSELDEVSSKEIELEENVVRKDLDWMERCEALRQLDSLKRAKYGDAKPSRYSEGKGWALADTADAIGVSRSAVSEAIKLAKDLREHPELVSKVKKLPMSAARKRVRQEIDADMLRRRVESGDVKVASNLMLGDACDLIQTLEDESVHLWLTDPPFGLQDIVDVGTGLMNYAKDAPNVSTEDNMRFVYQRLIPRVYTKLVPGAHIYVFLGMGWYHELINMLRGTGFIVDDLPLIWYKGRPSMPGKDIHYMSSYEAILFGHKPPQNRMLRKPICNVLMPPTISPQMKVHSLQKPFDLLKLFIENSSEVGEVVLDTFAGSASTLVAAAKLQRSGIGFELDEGNYLRAQTFMKKELK